MPHSTEEMLIESEMGFTMNCLEAQSRMMEFIRDEMDDESAEAFLAHVDACKDCYEELQIHYCVYEGIKMLDEDKLDSLNIQHALNDYIRQTKERLHRRRRRRRVLLWSLIAVGLLLLAGLVIYSGIALPRLL